MNYEEKKRYLEKFAILDAHIDALLDEKKKWYSRALEMEESNADGNKKEDVVDASSALDKVIQLEHEIDCEIDRLVDMRSKINNAIKRLDDCVLQQILFSKYISGKVYETIGDEIGYCVKQVCRLHKKAIEKINFE